MDADAKLCGAVDVSRQCHGDTELDRSAKRQHCPQHWCQRGRMCRLCLVTCLGLWPSPFLKQIRVRCALPALADDGSALLVWFKGWRYFDRSRREELHIHSDRNAKGVEHSSRSLATDSTGYLAGAVAIERVVGERGSSSMGLGLET